MRICRFFQPALGARLGAVDDGWLYDLSAIGRPELATFEAFLHACDNRVEAPDAWLAAHVAAAPRVGLIEPLQRAPDPAHAHLLRPLDVQEVWAAGVTYYRSLSAREEESHRSGIYDRVYAAERPEIFFKATPHRTVGPYEPVRIRSDSCWCVPEPELALVLSPQLRLIGYTVSNDISARDIEGENPLYLPQAKVHLGCCALGPCIALADEFERGGAAMITCTIRRGGAVAFQGQTRTDRIKRPLAELIAYLGRDNAFPAGAILLTGTGIVPPDELSLQPGDWVDIEIDRIGILHNPVERR